MGGTALSIIDLQAMQVVRVLDVSDVKGNGPALVLVRFSPLFFTQRLFCSS